MLRPLPLLDGPQPVYRLWEMVVSMATGTNRCLWQDGTFFFLIGNFTGITTWCAWGLLGSHMTVNSLMTLLMLKSVFPILFHIPSMMRRELGENQRHVISFECAARGTSGALTSYVSMSLLFLTKTGDSP